MLFLYHANRLEDLADQLANNLNRPMGSILSPEVIAVPGSAMSEWLTLRLAQAFGISANVQWLLPAQLLWKIFRATLSNVPETNAFSSEVLSWRVFKVLQDSAFVESHKPLRRYLQSTDPLRAWQLSRQMGRLYEQYLVFRPDWISTWEESASGEWQGALWNRLVKTGDSRHWLQLRGELYEKLEGDIHTSEQLPRRFSLFALSGLSPAFLEWAAQLARHTEVHVYHLNFSAGFWADIVSDRERARLIASEGEAIEPFLDTGNRLLAAMGRVGRQYLSQLMTLQAVERETYLTPERTTMLGCIQADIVELNEDWQGPEPGLLSDRSVEVHVCHSPMREIEVLHDQLLDAFEQDPHLYPADVRVLIPKLADYAPAISAIFGSAAGNRSIPWTLAEGGVLKENALIRAVDGLMAIADTRLDARRVHALLDFPFIRSRFAIDEADVDQIETWIRKLGIVWGADKASLDALGMALDPTHTWRGGTDRMLLGFGLGEGTETVDGILPLAPGDSSSAELLGHWRTFIEAVIALQGRMSVDRSLSQWIVFLNDVIDEFFLFSAQESDALIRLRHALASLARDGQTANSDEVLPLVVIKDALRRKTTDLAGGRFMSGGVTFSSLASGRCLPAKLVCLVGMNASDFPGRENHHGLDQMAARPRPGDRNRRDDDRFAFLEAVMSARERLYVSYSGANSRDDSVQPPSNVVDELLKATSVLKADQASTGARIIQHPLQPFSRRYFDPASDLFSYADEMAPGSTQDLCDRTPLFAQTLSPLEPGELSIDRLFDFLANPARALLRDRLNVRLETSAGFLPIREPMHLNYRSKRALFRRAVIGQLEGSEKVDFLDYAKHSGLMPAGPAGEVAGETIWASATSVCLRLKPLMKEGRGQTLSLKSPIAQWQVIGELDGIFEGQQILWFADRLNPWTMLDAWCRHLLLNTDPDRQAAPTLVISPDETVTLSSTIDAPTELGRLVDLYSQGMVRPLAFFPRSAFKWAEKRDLKAAYGEWLGSEFARARAESTDPYFSLAFRHEIETALDGEFPLLARLVTEPLLAAMEIRA